MEGVQRNAPKTIVYTPLPLPSTIRLVFHPCDPVSRVQGRTNRQNEGNVGGRTKFKINSACCRHSHRKRRWNPHQRAQAPIRAAAAGTLRFGLCMGHCLQHCESCTIHGQRQEKNQVAMRSWQQHASANVALAPRSFSPAASTSQPSSKARYK